MYRWCYSGVGVMPGLELAAGGQVAFRRRGFARRLCCGCGCCAPVAFSLVSGCSLMLLFSCTQGCWVPCVLLCLFLPPPCALGVSCRRRLFGALFVCSRSYAVGLRSWAGSPSWSVPFGGSCCCLRCYTCSLCCVTKRRSSWACMGNPKLEQETIEGTHARESQACQRRPTKLHEGQRSNPPIRALYMQLAKTCVVCYNETQ